MIITIGRQFGSGGREIGEKVAKRLGYAFYDKEILTMAAEESGFSPAAMQHYDEKPSGSLIYSLYMTGAATSDNLPLNQQLAFAQFNIIRKVAQADNCVIVGRCADYVLRAYENCYHFFLHAPLVDRMERATKEYGENPNNIKSTVLKHDKARANYYYHYTSQKWGDAKLYDLSLNTSRTGVDGAVKMLLHYLETIHAV